MAQPVVLRSGKTQSVVLNQVKTPSLRMGNRTRLEQEGLKHSLPTTGSVQLSTDGDQAAKQCRKVRLCVCQKCLDIGYRFHAVHSPFGKQLVGTLVGLALTMDKNTPGLGCEFFQTAMRPYGYRRPWSDLNRRPRTALCRMDARFLEVSDRGYFNVLDSRAANAIHLKYLRANGGAEPAFPALVSIRANSHHATSEKRLRILHWSASICQLNDACSRSHN